MENDSPQIKKEPPVDKIRLNEKLFTNQDIFCSLEQFCSSNNLSTSLYKNIFFRSAPSLTSLAPTNVRTIDSTPVNNGAIASPSSVSATTPTPVQSRPVLSTPSSPIPSSAPSTPPQPMSPYTANGRAKHGALLKRASYENIPGVAERKNKRTKKGSLNHEMKVSVSFEDSSKGCTKTVEFECWQDWDSCSSQIKRSSSSASVPSSPAINTTNYSAPSTPIQNDTSTPTTTPMNIVEQPISKKSTNTETTTESTTNNDNVPVPNDSSSSTTTTNDDNGTVASKGIDSQTSSDTETSTSSCPQCGGARKIARTKWVEVQVPKGVTKGLKKVLKGEGHKSENASGDLIIEFDVENHPFFKRDGDNALCTVDISVFQAVLGTKVQIPKVYGKDNEKQEINIEAGTQSLDVICIPGQGFTKLNCKKKRGDLVITVKVEIPRNLTKEQRELFERLAAIDSILHLSSSFNF